MNITHPTLIPAQSSQEGAVAAPQSVHFALRDIVRKMARPEEIAGGVAESTACCVLE